MLHVGICVYESPPKTLVDDLIPNVSKTVDDTSVEPLKETMIQSDVKPDVITYVVQFDAPIVTSHDNPSKEPESESVPEGEKLQQEETYDASEGNKTVYGNDQNSGSKGENDNSTGTREDDKTLFGGVSDKEKADQSISDEEGEGKLNYNRIKQQIKLSIFFPWIITNCQESVIRLLPQSVESGTRSQTAASSKKQSL